MKSAPPSRNTSKDGTLTGLLSLFKAKILQTTDDMLPAVVIAYDRATNRAKVQPRIDQVTTLNQIVPRAQIASVPVLQVGAGGCVISFNIKTGDLGWIKANDRDISLFKKNYKQSPPNTQRKHKFSDAVFIPDSFMKDVVINSEDDSNLVIQTNDGTVRIAIWNNKVKVTAPSIILDTPITTCTGNLIVEGGVMATDDVVAGTISLQTHVHGGVMTGGSDTGVPVP